MKNLRIVSSCLLNGEHLEAGSVLKDVSPHDAADLLGNGRAVEISGTLETREPVIEHRDPKPVRRTRAK